VAEVMTFSGLDALTFTLRTNTGHHLGEPQGLERAQGR